MADSETDRNSIQKKWLLLAINAITKFLLFIIGCGCLFDDWYFIIFIIFMIDT